MKRDISDSGSVCIVCHCKSHDTMGNIMHNNNSLWLCVTLADGDAVERVCAYLCVRARACVCIPLFDGQEESETTKLFIKLIGSGCC